MKLSVRARVLSTYALLAALVLVILVSGLIRLKRIGSKLDLIQNGYIPIAKIVNSFPNFYHLDETFDVQKLIANQNNRLFLDAITTHYPILMEGSMRRGLERAQEALAKVSGATKEPSFERITELANDMLAVHKRYLTHLRTTIELVQAGRVDEALAHNDDLVAQKRLVRSRLELLSRTLDDRINRAINATSAEERNTVLSTVGLSVGTLILALVIGLIAIWSLRPLNQLKKAAQEIAAGELHRRVEITTQDEVGDLAREFNRMADSIQERDAALRAQQEQLLNSEKMAVVGRMASKISHEIRNPLNALGLNLEVLHDEVKSEESKQALKATMGEIDRLNRIAESYLTLARSPKQMSEDIDLIKVLNQTERLIRPECANRGIRLTVNLPEKLPLLRFSATRMEQAVLNLVRNAMEASDREGEILIQAREGGGWIVLEVADRGKGIPPEALPHVFEPFYTTKDKGTGLGLAITHEIIHEQGGTIHCESRVGEGTRFIVRLPTAKA